jgi:ABC-type branched-subunit amino acid transport system substrate-binding protein
MRRLTFAWFAIAAAIPLGFFAGCKGSDSEKPIEIGHIHGASQTSDEFRGIQFAVEELNADPARLPLGRKIQVRHAPGASTPDEWGAQATRLIHLNRVAGLVCAGGPEDAERIGTAVSGDGVVAISTAGWATAQSQNLFTIGLAPTERGRALAVYLKEKKPKSVLVIRDPAAKSAKLAADSFLAELATSSIRVTEVDASIAEKPSAEAVFFACSTKAALEHRPKDALRIYGDDPADLLTAGAAADEFIVATVNDADIIKERRSPFVGQFQRVFGLLPTGESSLAYDSLRIWAEAARRANSLEAAAIRDQLLKRENPFDSLTGSLTFADDHTARRPIFVGRIADGRLRDVKEVPAGPIK